MNFSEEERDEFESQLEQVDEKTLLIQQLTELAAIRTQLEALNQHLAGDTQTLQDGQETRVCVACNQEVRVGELESHAVAKHNAPPDSDIDGLGLFE